MATFQSPGVYSTFTDLTSYVANVPVSLSFMAFLADQGPDNELMFVSDQQDFLTTFGNPNYPKYGTKFGQAMLNAEKQVTSSGGGFFMRVLPSDAHLANLATSIVRHNGVSDEVIEYYDHFSTAQKGDTAALAFFQSQPLPPAGYDFWYSSWIMYPIGRGEHYNRYQFRFTKVINKNHIYALDIYENTDSGDQNLVEYYEVSFHRDDLDDSFQSIFIEDVLAANSQTFRASVNTQYDHQSLIEAIMLHMPSVQLKHVVDSVTTPPLAPLDGDIYFVLSGGQNGGVYGDFTDQDGNFATWDHATLAWIFSDCPDGTIFKNLTESDLKDQSMIYTHFGNGYIDEYCPYIHDMIFNEGEERYPNGGDLELKEIGGGTDGNIWNTDGTLNVTHAATILANAYGGVIDESVYDTDNVLFDLVYDANYPDPVKQSISDLCKILRKDCHGFIDITDEINTNNAVKKRQQAYPYNTPYVSLWANFSKIYDNWSSKDLWVSPSFHLSYIVPLSDQSTHPWFAFTGLRRGVCDLAKELRFNPKQGDRENLYAVQLNYLVRLEGFPVLWQQLTSQARPSAMQDINIVRLVLYIDRALRKYCRFYIYEPNDDISYQQVSGDINDFLEEVKKMRGLDSYSVEVDATPYEKKRKEMHVNVILEPTRTIEKIWLRHYIK